MTAAPIYATPTAREIVLGFCAASGFTYLQLIAKSRHRYWVGARRRIAGQLRDLHFTFAEIGEAPGGQHHTTIMALLRVSPGKAKPSLEVCK